MRVGYKIMFIAYSKRELFTLQQIKGYIIILLCRTKMYVFFLCQLGFSMDLYREHDIIIIHDK